jgi:Flp pilus assembly protein TadD
MGIKGDTRSMPLANVLQDLATNEQTGTLHIKSRDRAVALWFERGALRLVGLGPGEGPSLVNGLLALNKLRPDEVPATAPGRRVSEFSLLRGLLKKGRLTRDDLKAALEHQMAEHLCDAFLWPDAHFEFEEGDPDDRGFDADQLDLEPRIPVDSVLFEAVRRTDEWTEVRKVILSPDEIFTADARRMPADADATARRLAGLLNGERSLRDILDVTRLGQFIITRAAARLVKAGAARPLTPPEAAERARARAAAREWEAALKMARYGLAHERSNAQLLDIALRSAEALDDHEAAAGFGRQLITAQVESGALEAAVATCQKVLAHAPRDTTAHERLFELYLRLDRKLEALTAGEALAAAYKKAGLPDQALAVYRQLVEKVGDQPDLLESLAEIQRRLGDKREAILLYRKLLSRALESRHDEVALDYCHTLLRLDPAHEEALRLRKQIESGQIELNRRRRRRVKIIAALGAVLIVVAAGGFYEWGARDEYGEVRTRILNASVDKRYREALLLYDRVVQEWSWSLVAHQLRPDRAAIEGRFVAEELERAKTLEGRGQLADAQKTLEDALELSRADENPAALQAAVERVRKRRQEEEAKWDRELKGKTPEQVGQVREPLAVPALEKLLGGGAAPEARAALAALGAIEGEAATLAIIRALPDPDLAKDAAAQLAARTKQDFGNDRLRWEAWWIRSRRPGGKLPPLQAALVAPRTAFAAGEAAVIEWRVVNLGSAEAVFELEADPARRIRVVSTAAEAAAPAEVPKEAPPVRTVRLAPGEFMGGTTDLSSRLDKPGRRRVLWAAPLRVDGKPASLEALPLVVDRTP